MTTLDKTQALDRTRDQVHLLKKRLVDVRKQLEARSGKARIEVRHQIERLERQADQLEERLAAAKDEASQGWDSIRGDLATLIDDFREAAARTLAAARD